jgi:hypothetical protein
LICHSERNEESHGFRYLDAEILRLTPQNDIVKQPLYPPLKKGDFFIDSGNFPPLTKGEDDLFACEISLLMPPFRKGGLGGFPYLAGTVTGPTPPFLKYPLRAGINPAPTF